MRTGGRALTEAAIRTKLPVGEEVQRSQLGNESAFQVSTMLVRSLAVELERRGISPENLLGDQALGLLDPGTEYVPLAQYQALLARGVALSGDAALGLYCGLEASESSFGLISPLISHAATLRRGIELVSQFQPLLVEGISLHLVEHGAAARLRCEFLSTEIAKDRSLVELAMAGLMRTLRQFGCKRESLTAVRFEHPCPAHHPAYTRAFSGLAQFSQPFTGFEFSATLLDRRNLTGEPNLHALVLAEAERSLERQARDSTWADRVYTLLRAQSLKGLPDLVDSARMLGLSSRTLRRRLEMEGTSYRQLTQMLLHESACSLLRNPRLTLQQIADTLGFSDASAFHRAFRRWSGESPARYRSRVCPAHAEPRGLPKPSAS